MLQALILHPEWVLGFIDAEGCFHVAIQNNRSMRLGVQVQLQFSVSQHTRDRALLERFIPFFGGVGHVVNEGPTMVQYRIRGINDLSTHLFPFLDAHPLLTVKSNDYADFRRVHSLMSEGLHLTPEGLAHIKLIKASMNLHRDI